MSSGMFHITRRWRMGMLCLLMGTRGVMGQIVINQTQPPSTLVQSVLMGPGVFATNVIFNGAPGTVPAPVGTGPSEIGRFNGSNTALGIGQGIFLCTSVANTHIPGPNDRLDPTGGGIGAGQGIMTPDLDLSRLTGWPYWQVNGGSNIYNKAILEFDFIPMSDMVSFRYVFSSEEYERWACSQYNDVFGFFLSGPGINGPYSNNAINIALLPGSLTPVSVNTVNSGLMNANNANGPDWMDPFRPCFDADPNWQANAIYYRYNGGQWPVPQPPAWALQMEAPYNTDPSYIQHNGMTVVLTASAAVECGQQYHMKIGVSNVLDSNYPSAVFLEGGSFTSSDRFSLAVAPGPNVLFTDTDTIFYESQCDSVHLRFRRHAGHYLDEWLQVTTGGDATAGVDYMSQLPDSVHFAQLDSVVVVPIHVPVDEDGPEELIVNLITCNGLKVQTYVFVIDQRPPLEVELDDIDMDCPGTVTLTPSVTGGSGDPALLTYLWSTGATTPSITVDVDQTTQFWVTVQDSCWTLPVTDSAWVHLPNVDPLALVLPADTAIPCLGTAVLHAGATGGTPPYVFQWSLNGTPQGSGEDLEVPAAEPPVHYVVQLTDACGTMVTDSVLVSQAPPEPLVITVPPDTAVACLGTADLEATTTGGGGMVQIVWTLGGAVVGSGPVITVPAADHALYTATASDQCGQTMSADVVVTTGPTPPLVVEAVGDTVACPGMDAMLEVLSVSGGGGVYAYQWSAGGSVLGDATSLTVPLPASTWYTIQVTDECGNSADTSVAAVVTTYPPLVVEAWGDTTVCPGIPVDLGVTVQGGAAPHQVIWPGLGQGEVMSWIAQPPSLHAMVQVTDACGIIVTDTVHIGVFPARLRITGTAQSDVNWQFTAHPTPALGGTVVWDLGDGTTGTGEVISHVYADEDAYWVVAWLTTLDGCVVADSLMTPPPDPVVYFPNAFTPNNDGVNDLFGGVGRFAVEYRLEVYDRWGRVVFESNDIGHRWDGRFATGEDVPDGVYPYRYHYKGEDRVWKSGHGHVTLLR